MALQWVALAAVAATAAAVSGNGSWPWSPGKLVIRQVQRLPAVLPASYSFWTNELHVAIDVVQRRHTHFAILLILFVLVAVFHAQSRPAQFGPASFCLYKFRLLIVLAWRLASN